MERTILRASGAFEKTEVGDNFSSWNECIGARVGEVVQAPDKSLELWCDEEGLLCEREFNFAASVLAMRPIVGDVIVFYPEDIK